MLFPEGTAKAAGWARPESQPAELCAWNDAREESGNETELRMLSLQLESVRLLQTGNVELVFRNMGRIRMVWVFHT